MKRILISLISLLLLTTVYSSETQLDVMNYKVTIEPNIQEKSVKGSVFIKFRLPLDKTSLVLSSGNLQIDAITGEFVESFKKSGNDLIVQLSETRSNTTELTIDYSGLPKKGLLFDQKNNQAHTVYFTDHWMISNSNPNDKATISINIIIDKELDCIANGKLVNVIESEKKKEYQWNQDFETPAYTFGFAIGKFNSVKETLDNVILKYFSDTYTPDQLKIIFKETSAIISFLEEKSGIKFDQSTYSQILIGDHYQEMSGFSVLKNSYGNLVLNDSTETNLISHELAHQWWGNRITCESWNHIWLNEGIATYLSAAFNEYRFGQYKYNADINSYFNVYQDIKKRGKDRSLVFEDWSNPSRDDRNLVYFKGAYVIYLLKRELGDEKFWRALRFYSKKFYGKSVSTSDFQLAFEESSGYNLDEFFSKWVYNN